MEIFKKAPRAQGIATQKGAGGEERGRGGD